MKRKRRHRPSLSHAPHLKRKKPWPLGERPPWVPLLAHQRWPTVREVTLAYPGRAFHNGFSALFFGTAIFGVLAAGVNKILGTSVFTASWADGAPVDRSDAFTFMAWAAVVFAEWWTAMYATIRGWVILDGAD